MVLIPFKSGPSFLEQVTLDGTPYKLKVYWNSRNAFWGLAVFTIEDVLILGGIRLFQGINLIGGHPDIGLPPGELWVVDLAGDLSEPGYEDFTGDRQLHFYYVEEGDIGSDGSIQ